LLGEPPVNWKKINKTEDLGPWIFQRDEYYAGVVEKEVIQKNRRALLIMGSLHFIKKGWGIDPQAGNNAPMAFNNADPGDTSGGTFMKSAPVPSKNEAGKISIKKIEEPNNTNSNKQAPNVAQILEKKYPGKLFIILPYDGYGDMVANKEIEEKLDPKKPSLLITGNSWPGNMEAGRLYGRRSLALTNGKVTGEVIYDPYPNLKISDLCDAFLYISDRKNMARSLPVNIYSDTAYIKELNRRSIIMNGNPFKLSDYTDTSLKIHTF
jgi:hypothetical protein